MSNETKGPQPPAEAQPVDGLRMVKLSDAWDYANGRLSWNDLDARAVRHEGAATPLSREHGSVQEMFNPSAPVGVDVGDKDYLTTCARELLADEYRKRGIGTGLVNDAGTATSVAIAAIATALAQQPAAVDEGVIVIDGRRYAVETVRTALLGLAADVTRDAAQQGGSDNDR